MSSPPTTTVSVRVLVFAKFAELLGRESLEVTVPSPATVGDVVDRIREREPAARSLPPELLYALNRRHVPLHTEVGDGDELALLPPLAGG